MKEYMRSEGLALPCVLLDKDGRLRTVLKKSELDGFGGDQIMFEQALGKSLGPML